MASILEGRRSAQQSSSLQRTPTVALTCNVAPASKPIRWIDESLAWTGQGLPRSYIRSLELEMLP